MKKNHKSFHDRKVVENHKFNIMSLIQNLGIMPQFYNHINRQQKNNYLCEICLHLRITTHQVISTK